MTHSTHHPIRKTRVRIRIASSLVAAVVLVAAQPVLAAAVHAPFLRVPAGRVTQSGKLPKGVPAAGSHVLANEPEQGSASLILEFDLAQVPQSATPLALLQLGELEKQKVKRPGQPASEGRGALHVLWWDGATNHLAGSTPVKPAGIPTAYTIDVTRIVSGALSRPANARKLQLEVRMTGKPAYYEVYGLLAGLGRKPPTLEVAACANWTNDWAQRLQPVTDGPVVYREACMAIAESRQKELVLPLLYPARRVLEVIHNGTGESLESGRDWLLRDGKLVLPPGSRAPVQLGSEFFMAPIKQKDGTTNMRPTQIRLVEGTWYHERQIEVSYEPAARDWKLPAPVSSLGQLPRLKKLLTAKAPVKLLLFGDSISLGGNASKFQGGWPYQPAFGELVAWGLQRHYGNQVTFLNHSRGGAGAAFGASQAASQAGWFKADLVILGYGMNDRREERRATYRASLEKIIDTIREQSPQTEFILVTSMLNNPKQPAGLEPVLALRDEALKIARPGLAFVDMTTTHQEIVKRKHYLDTSGNGANHPNDFLHRIYAQRILEVLLPADRAPAR